MALIMYDLGLAAVFACASLAIIAGWTQAETLTFALDPRALQQDSNESRSCCFSKTPTAAARMNRLNDEQNEDFTASQTGYVDALFGTLARTFAGTTNCPTTIANPFSVNFVIRWRRPTAIKATIPTQSARTPRSGGPRDDQGTQLQ